MTNVRQAIAYGIAILVAVLALAALPLYVDWLWFIDLGYAHVFTTILSAKILLGVVTGVVFFLVVWGNAWFALRSNANRIELYTTNQALPIFLDRIIRRGVEFVVILGAIVLSIMVGLEASTHWQSWIMFRNYVPFMHKDPVFGIDIGFYVFKLDFIEFAYRTLMLALISATIAAGAILYLTRTLDLLQGKLKITKMAAGHLGTLLALIAAAGAIGFRLAEYSLLFSEGSALYGAGYADVHVRLPALHMAIIASLIGAVLVLVAARRQSLPLAITGLVLGLAVNTVVGGGIGALVQRVTVLPDELNKESPYIARHIRATQEAYGLRHVDRIETDVTGTLTAQALQKNQVTLQSVRLWAYRPLLAAYAQLQEIQQYYAFSDVDVDRYTLNGTYRQVMLSTREMDQDALPSDAKTWVNLRLKYTHGYGIVMSPVNELTPEGLPKFFLKDIPPVGLPELRVTQPQIYFGEDTDSYVLVDTRVREFDYPKGTEGAFTTYHASSGVPLGGILRRCLLALRFGDLNLILPGNLRSTSRILFRRNIDDRAGTIAPFLQLDHDPYIVLSKGHLYWIQDAYTYSDMYPYAQPTGIVDPNTGMVSSLNYIRNSVKIVTDAYSGRVTYYVFDESDPMIRAYEKAFPGMFHPQSDMPPDLRLHVRYPEDLFTLQTRVYATYHMSDTQQFYNRGDLWDIPSVEQTDEDGGGQGPMEPYYVVMRLPGAKREEFILMTPYTRAKKDNMVAWMAAKCDESDYGHLILYEFPKGQQFFGPAQIQARANQNTEISDKMTLWNQQKSAVSRGDLLVIPIDKSMLYVEPIYLQSTSGKIPEFKRVIVALGGEITMQRTLAEALNVLVGPGAGGAVPGITSAPAGTTQGQSSRAAPEPALIQRAVNLYDQAIAAQRRGDWAEYGRMQKALGDLLRGSAGQGQKRAAPAH